MPAVALEPVKLRLILDVPVTVKLVNPDETRKLLPAAKLELAPVNVIAPVVPNAMDLVLLVE